MSPSSPRRPLANLSTNTPLTSSKAFAGAKSPAKAGLVFYDIAETRGIKRSAADLLDASTEALHHNNKRWQGEEEPKEPLSQCSEVARGSFSSMINYDPSSEPNSVADIEGPVSERDSFGRNVSYSFLKQTPQKRHRTNMAPIASKPVESKAETSHV
jgi:hypothetical protein